MVEQQKNNGWQARLKYITAKPLQNVREIIVVSTASRQQLFLWNYKGFCSYLHHNEDFCLFDKRQTERIQGSLSERTGITFVTGSTTPGPGGSICTMVVLICRTK